MTGYEKVFYGMSDRPCKIAKHPGLGYDRDGLYFRYFNILTGEWILKHFTSRPIVYQGPLGSHYT